MTIPFLRSATPRILVFYIAILIKIVGSALSAIGFVLNSTAMLLSGTIFWIAFFVALLVIADPGTDIRMKSLLTWLKLSASPIIVILIILGIALIVVVTFIGLESFFSQDLWPGLSELLVSLDRVYGYNDATALSHQGTDNVLAGKNPYAESNIVTATMKFHGSIDKLTPLREGEFANVFPYPTMEELDKVWEAAKKTPEQIPPEIESRFNYPAGSFLIPAPFIWMGIHDFRIVYAILLAPVLVYVFIKIPRKLIPHLAIALVASLELWNSLVAGETGFLYFPFILMAWVLRERNFWLSVLFMGIAVIVKQIAWFLLPFYFILLFRTNGVKSVFYAGLIISAIFVAANAPFIAIDPYLWFRSVIAPVFDNMFPLGVGIITLVTGGIVDIREPMIFTIIEITVGVAAITWYFFKCRRYPDTALILSVLPLFFAWRSLWGYFFYIDIILIASILMNDYGRSPQTLPGPVAEEAATV